MKQMMGQGVLHARPKVIVTAGWEASEGAHGSGLSTGEFAELLGVSVRTLQGLGAGRRDLTALPNFAAGCGQTSEDFAWVSNRVRRSSNQHYR